MSSGPWNYLKAQTAFIKKSPIHPLHLVIALALAIAFPAFAEEEPNIVLIISDDQAWTDYGFMGHLDIRTPHLDKLTGLDAPDRLPDINLLDERARNGHKRVFGETHSIHNMTPGDPDDTLQYL